jgi:uncharacterized protein (DUF302 family)
LINTRYTFVTSLNGSIAQVRPLVEAALRDEGFGVLTEIDLAATLKAKIGRERSPYLILGACNARLADVAVEREPSIGALLPCNVVLREDEPGRTTVEIMHPIVAFNVTGNPALEPLALEANERLRRVMAALVP